MNAAPAGRLATAASTLARILLGALFLVAGVGHLVAPEAFLAQTPTWLPARAAVVLVSGVVELLLGVGLLTRRWRRPAGLAAAAFLLLVWPGNVHQAVAGVDAFGLETDRARWIRVAFQPVLILLALLAARRPSAPDYRRPDATGGFRP